ncbi:hypothetical protein RF11_02687 [Thelohanellus kitauei]|uniref:Uncharacterized protein n=1 Tax=Thelohanellus kitauei TaxID=669202 RepID=A0A0C2J824_THEKT|nr:hypothetical protein RF11_02687 [Thelohanellus kitauei]
MNDYDDETAFIMANFLKCDGLCDIVFECYGLQKVVNDFRKMRYYKKLRYDKNVTFTTINFIIKIMQTHINIFCTFAQAFLSKYLILHLKNVMKIQPPKVIHSDIEDNSCDNLILFLEETGFIRSPDRIITVSIFGFIFLILH